MYTSIRSLRQWSSSLRYASAVGVIALAAADARAGHQRIAVAGGDIASGAEVSSIAVANDWVYWGEPQDPEFVDCARWAAGERGVGEGNIKRVPRGGCGPVTTLYSNCDAANPFRPRFMQTDGVYVYYATGTSIQRLWVGDDETRDPAYPPETLATAAAEVRGLALDPSPEGSSVFSQLYVYWSEPTRIRRIAKDGSGFPATIVFPGAFDGTLSERGLAVDQTHVFFLTTWSIDPPEGAAYKKSKNGTGETTQLGFSVGDPKHLAVQGDYVFFTDTVEPFAPPRIRVVRKPKSLPPEVLDETGYVVGTLGGLEGWVATGLAVDASHAFWSDMNIDEVTVGRLGRAENEPGGLVEETFVAGLSSVSNVVLDADYVYFSAVDEGHADCDGVPGPAGSGIFRVEKTAVAHQVNLKWLGMEVTQGIQNMNNEVDLVSDKQTLVRVYPTADISDEQNVRAILEVKLVGAGEDCDEPDPRLAGSVEPTARDGMDIPVLSNMTRGAVDFERLNLQRSFNFWLPEDWTDGRVCMKPRLDPGGIDGAGSVAESDEADNEDLCLCKEFVETADTCLVVRPIDTTNVGNFRTSSDGFWDIIDRYETLWPTAEITVFEEDEPLQELQLCPWPCYGPYESDNLTGFGSKVMWSLGQWWLFSDDDDICDLTDAAVHYVGLVHPNASSGSASGYSLLDGPPVSWVKMTSEPVTTFDSPSGGSTFAQETSHNYWTVFAGCPPSWEHVDCGDPEGVDPFYPYCLDQICSPCDACPSDSHFGYDRLTSMVVDPMVARDYMSYCSPAWVSDYIWEGMIDVLSPDGCAALARAAGVAAAQLDGSRPAGAEMLLVFGRIIPGAIEQAEFRSYRLPLGVIGSAKLGKMLEAQAAYTLPGSSHALELVNGVDAVLFSQPFDPPPVSQHIMGAPLTFTLVIPYDAGAARVRIMNMGAEIGGGDVSASAPMVSIAEPSSASPLIGDSLTITWDGFDADAVDLDDGLFYVVQYSPNFGRTWQALVTDYPTDVNDPEVPNGTTTLTLSPIGSLSGSRGTAPGIADCHYPSSLIRVIATDGVNSGIAVSEPFQVACRPPVAHITTPPDGSVHFHTDEIALSGRSMDPEQGRVSADRMLWSVVPGGFVGTGTDLILPGLPPGIYDIVLQAFDAQDMIGTDQVRIIVTACRAPANAFDGGQVADQQPGQDELYDSDRDSSIVDILADNFSFAEDTQLTGLRWFGGYSYDSGAPAADDFGLQILADENGTPGSVLWSVPRGAGVSRAPTGAIITSSAGDVPEYAYDIGFCEPFVARAATTYWLAIANNSSGHPTTWGWELGIGGDNRLAVSRNGQPWVPVVGFGDLALELFEAVPKGSCCVAGGGCGIMTADQCTLNEGRYNGEGSTCPVNSADVCRPGAMVTLFDGANSHDNRCAASDGPGDDRCYADPSWGGLHDEVWYQYTATCSGQLTVSMCPSDGGYASPGYDAYLVIYGNGTSICGCPLGLGSELACGDDSCGQRGSGPSINTNVTQGQCYTIAVGGWDDGTNQGHSRGTGVIQVDCSPCDGHNVGLGRQAIASRSLPTNPPELAVDGVLGHANRWSADDFAPQWIQLDLGASYTVGRIRLIVEQSPDGDTHHRVLGKGPSPADPFLVLHEFVGPTTSGQALEFSPPIPWTNLQYIRVETLQSPSWVAWQEMEVFCALPGPVCEVASPPTVLQWDSNPSTPASLVDLKLNRYLAIQAPGSAGRAQAIRVHFKSLPPPWNVWNGTRTFVTAPQAVCETSGIGPGGNCGAAPTFRRAGLTCDPNSAAFLDWTTIPGGAVYVSHPAVVSNSATIPAEYEIQMLDSTCDSAVEGSYSPVRTVTGVKWGDVCGSFDPSGPYYVAANGTVDVAVDMTAALNKFANRPFAPGKARVDVEPCAVDAKINITDVTRILDGFRNLPFPFSPSGGFGCTGSDPCVYVPLAIEEQQ